MDPIDAYRLFLTIKSKHEPLLREYSKDLDLIDQVFSGLGVKVEGKELSLIKPPTAYDAVQNAADHILTDPRINVPVRPVEGAQYEANKLASRKRTARTR